MKKGLTGPQVGAMAVAALITFAIVKELMKVAAANKGSIG